MLADDPVRPSGLLDRAFDRIQSASRSKFGRDAAWLTSLTGFERVIAVVQAALVSRALGITEYGVFMLLFSTIGLVASSVALQMGLTGTVFVSKYRETEKAKAAAVISVVMKFAWLISAVVVLVTLPAYSRLSEWLLGTSQYQMAVLLGILFVGATVVSGVQDGVAQGFEMFVTMVKLKIAVAIPVLAAIYLVTRTFGLNGAMLAILAGMVIKYAILERAIWRRRSEAGIPHRGGGVSFRNLISDFTVPSMVVTLLVGLVTWLGTFLLSKQVGGLDQVAIASTGLQWRGPVLLLTASFGSVAIPAFSRMSAAGDAAGTQRLFRNLVLVNLLIASGVALVMVAASGLILKVWGSGFEEGRLAFCLIVLSTIPNVVAGVYIHQLVGAARMWRQLWLHVPSLVALSVSFAVLVPRYQAAGYGASLLIGAVVLWGQLAAAGAVSGQAARATRS